MKDVISNIKVIFGFIFELIDFNSLVLSDQTFASNSNEPDQKPTLLHSFDYKFSVKFDFIV